MLTCFILCALPYFAQFTTESEAAVDFMETHAREIAAEMPNLSPDERAIAISIVAPEVSQYSQVADFLELRALGISYLNNGSADFSVGFFQMKPSFVEELEKKIAANRSLKAKYAALIPTGTEREKRRTRFENLTSLQGQLHYLQVFIEVAKLRTASQRFASNEEKVRYWATLYNAGMNLSATRVAYFQKRKHFPRRNAEHNYGDVAAEFYSTFRERKW